ncbi:glycosyl transferase 2 family protein [Clostridium sp. CAG:306]|nr:glycosyl transferase 2 family protein [Clostridium sp. CAG:306]
MVDFLIFILVLVLASLLVYVMAYTVYFTACVFNSTKAKRFLLKQKYNAAAQPNNMIIIIYARNNESTIVPLLEALNKQNYNRENYQTHIILDHCTDNSSNILEFIGGAKIWRVGENAPVGKDEAVSWILEGLLSYQNVDAFVFLSADRYIDENFLPSINANLYGENILVGSTDYIARKKTLLNAIKTTYHSYTDRILNCGRSLMGFANIVDSDIFVIRKEVLDKIKCVDFKDINSELKYTTLLVRNGFVPKFCPLIKTYTSIDNFKDRKQSISYKISLVWNCLPLLIKSSPKFGEFLINTLTPNFWLLILIYAGLLSFTNSYELPKFGFINFNLIFFFFGVLTLAFIASLFTSKIGKGNIIYLLLYPVYSLLKIFLHIPVIGTVINKLTNNKDDEDREMSTVDVYVTDGKNNLKCKLDLISESGLVKAVFRFKKKKYSSSSQIRMVDAIKEVSDKLNEHGFRIKICQSCGFFNLKMDGSTNMIKGYCNKPVVQNESDIPLDTILWNSCPYYVPQEVNKIIDINSFREN